MVEWGCVSGGGGPSETTAEGPRGTAGVAPAIVTPGCGLARGLHVPLMSSGGLNGLARASSWQTVAFSSLIVIMAFILSAFTCVSDGFVFLSLTE